MRRLISTDYSAWAFNAALFFLRLTFGILIMSKGYEKLVHFAGMKASFYNFLGLGGTTSLILVIFAEFFCGLFITLGLFTRLSAIPLIIQFCVLVFKINHMHFLGEAFTDTLFLGAFFAILLVGPGKISVDGVSGK